MSIIPLSVSDYSSDLQQVLELIAARGAVLFLGSGFSAQARGLADDEMPTAQVLANAIGKLGKFDDEGDLRYASDRYLKEGSPALLVQLLKQTFTVRAVDQYHRDIASAPWRRVYTTNYDLCFERAAEEIGKLVETVDVSAPPSDFEGRNNVCVHINGSLRNLTVESLSEGFKLTTSSYLAPESFTTSGWGFPFQRDMDFASAIVFVGYSMYDIEVQKILHANQDYKKKTFFVTSDTVKERVRFTLENFGTVIPIGASAFGDALAENAVNFQEEPGTLDLASLWRYEVDKSIEEIRDTDVDAFLMRGEIADRLIDAAVAGTKGAPILIRREYLTQARELLRAGTNLVVTGEFGNGKTIFLKSLRTQLALEGASVFTADKPDFHQHDDLERLVSSREKGYLFVDAYDQNLDLVRHYAELNPWDLKLILGARASNHERIRENVAAIGIKLSEVTVDELENDEVDQFIKIIDNVGYWGDRAAFSTKVKHDIVLHDHHAQLSMALLGLLSAPQMVTRVKELISGLISDAPRKDTVFAIALLSVLDQTLNYSLIAEIALNNAIYDSDLRIDTGFRQMFKLDGTHIKTKSSIFALALISHQFSSTYIVDQLLKIVTAIGEPWGQVREKKEIQKSLLRFSVVERLLPEKQRKNNLVRYYENLKHRLPWLKTDPHYWLQYGMSQVTYRDFDKAQNYFDQAYALARNRHDYHTAHIDTQQARLFLFRALENQDSAASYKYFSDAHQLLKKTPDDIYRYRQVEPYKDIYEQRYPTFSKASKAYFEQSCRAMLDDLVRAMSNSGYGFGTSRTAKRVFEILHKILDEIRAKREVK